MQDNFEWNFAYDLKFGLYEWNREDPAGERTLRDGAKVDHMLLATSVFQHTLV